MIAVDTERDLIERRLDKTITRYVLLKFEHDPKVVETFEFTTVERAAWRRRQLRTALLDTIAILQARLATLHQWT